MNPNLDSLVKNVLSDDFKYLSIEFNGELLELVKEKGVYPFEYMDSFKKISEDKLPDKSIFFSSLKDKCISEKDYQRANGIWNAFKMNSMGDYHDLHLKTDVLLLADVLDPCHYFSSPGLSWDAMLKMTWIEIELIHDIDMHLFIEKGMRDSISYIAKRYGKAISKYLECYDSSEESVYIIYLDANNMYGWAMIQ